ncbi:MULTISPECIES: TonB-dependent receptor [Bacteroides]|jgi:TonB-linked SusC/RagA family outer membrane protein|uniref:SusC/RagA family TonB-linked outer membrane protein n=1 Tax=Bacteroides TaxID=816 RepID=UPI000E51888A|nr:MULTISPECIES: TonB-dependent receptor [Bacteroides]RHL03881.1 TonB-dependent receptor [Bacteroides sp. AF39-11AC]
MKIKYILLFLVAWMTSMSSAYAQQTVTASGLVMDEKGEALIGVSVSVKEVPSMGAITDLDGRFRMTGIKTGNTLLISYIGYDTQEIKMTKNDERMRVVLKESANLMDEVVITASGKVQKKINVTGAVTGVEVATLKTPASSVTNMLGGRVPGIISVTRSGEPGKDFSEFWVRGISTFGAGQGALVLIDGIEGDLNTLDPEDIESFSILKDASSTAVYGVRGANGVVLVSTKKGKAGKLSLQVKANAGISYSARMPEFVNAADYAALANEAAVTRGRIPVYSDVDVDLFRNHMDPDLHPDVNWRDVILKDYTWNQQYFLSASGGGEVARYYISAGFTTKDAIFKQDKDVNRYNTNVNYNKFNFRANVDVNVTPTTTLSLNEETVIVSQNYPGYGNDTKALWEAQTNLTPVTVPLMYTTGEAPGYGSGNSQISPYVLLNMTGYQKLYSNNNKITMQLNQDLKMITPGLSILGLVNIDSYSALTQMRQKMPAIYYAYGRNRDGTLNLEKMSESKDPSYGNYQDSSRKFYWEFQLNYNRLFNKLHRVGALIKADWSDYEASRYNQLLTAIPKRYNSYSSRFSYSYDDTYMAEFNVGYTGSEAFEKGKKFGWFPAVSVGWAPTQYRFFRDRDNFINYFKIRASYGIVGNDRLTWDDSVRFPYLTLIGSTGSGIWNNGSGLTETQVGSSNLRWEKAKKANIGIDMRFLHERFDMTVDFFQDKRSGIYQQRQSVPEEMGLVTLPWANVGEMKSWGMDGTISYRQPLGDNDKYLIVRANYTQSMNEITNYEEDLKKYPYQSAVGYQSGINRGLIALGLFKDQAEIDNSPRQTFGDYLPGDIKYKDVNGDGLINSDDEVPLKYSYVPQIQYGFATEFNWKNFNVSVLFEGVSRVTYFKGGNMYRPFAQSAVGNVITDFANPANRWISREISGNPATENPNAKYPRLYYGGSANNDRNSTFWLSDGGYLRLKNIQVSYTARGAFLKKLGLQKAVFSLIGDNLAVWSKEKMLDPAQAGDNGNAYPIQRVYTLQLNLSF